MLFYRSNALSTYRSTDGVRAAAVVSLTRGCYNIIDYVIVDRLSTRIAGIAEDRGNGVDSRTRRVRRKNRRIVGSFFWYFRVPRRLWEVTRCFQCSKRVDPIKGRKEFQILFRSLYRAERLIYVAYIITKSNVHYGRLVELRSRAKEYKRFRRTKKSYIVSIWMEPPRLVWNEWIISASPWCENAARNSCRTRSRRALGRKTRTSDPAARTRQRRTVKIKTRADV